MGLLEGMEGMEANGGILGGLGRELGGLRGRLRIGGVWICGPAGLWGGCCRRRMIGLGFSIINI